MSNVDIEFGRERNVGASRQNVGTKTNPPSQLSPRASLLQSFILIVDYMHETHTCFEISTCRISDVLLILKASSIMNVASDSRLNIPRTRIHIDERKFVLKSYKVAPREKQAFCDKIFPLYNMNSNSQ
jgi:hypothetical protein